MKKITTCKSAWKHKNEWFILPCPKIIMEKTGIKTVDIYLTFEISWFAELLISVLFLTEKNSSKDESQKEKKQIAAEIKK